MNKTYKIVVWGCGLIAAAVALIYGTTLAVADADGPGGYEVSATAGALAVSVAVLCGVLSVVGWMIYANGKATSARIAADVSHAIAGVLDQRLHKVADQTADRSHDSLVQVMQEMADALRADFKVAAKRVHTQGMVDEANARLGDNVSSINGRRDA